MKDGVLRTSLLPQEFVTQTLCEEPSSVACFTADRGLDEDLVASGFVCFMSRGQNRASAEDTQISRCASIIEGNTRKVCARGRRVQKLRRRSARI